MKQLAHCDQGKQFWETYIARPSMILPAQAGTLSRMGGWALGAVGVDQLAAAMIDTVCNGAEQETYENADLLKKGSEILMKGGITA